MPTNAAPLDTRILDVTERIRERSRATRSEYLARARASRDASATRAKLSCTNLAHGFAASTTQDKDALKRLQWPNLAIVTSYNDMLSAHQPFERFPGLMRVAAREVGATAQVAGGVPAMCDGVTQGQTGMELSLFSRDVIAMSTALALSHNMFDATLCLGVCDKIVPGLLIGALTFGHLPTIFVPGGPMPSGVANQDKARIRKLYAEGKVSRAELLESECGSYHSAGTCTLYGTANKVALVTDGRMSGASGAVPAAIHITPEVASGGPLGKVRDGDIIRLDCGSGVLEAKVPAEVWNARELPNIDLRANEYGTGRELFKVFRANAAGAEQGGGLQING